ncbi:hypothetical protein QCO44_07935 [Selenomonas sputigena]|uniref:Energy transducer TonB n=1 Tax=Selenomonas sputigena TaxID=69823 RepID=A0ABV3X6Y0_9FIRM
MVVRKHWGLTAALAAALHIPAVGLMGLLLPEEMPQGTGELAWIDVAAEDGEASAGAKSEQEKTAEPPPEEPPVIVEEIPAAEEIPASPIEQESPPPQKTEKEKNGREDAPKPKPNKPRHYPPIRKPNKPAVLDEKTKHGLGAKETSYRGTAHFFVDISEEGRVVRIQAWRFEPEPADEKQRRVLAERLEERIKETWRYKPSLTPEGRPTTQTKPEELILPEQEEKK